MKKSISIFFSFLLLICMYSCADEYSSGTMHLYIHSDEIAKTIKLDDSVSDITKFSVSGIGPGGKTFTVDSTSSSIIIEGLPLGNWEIKANGYNTKGKIIATGSLNFTLSGNQDPQTINLNTISGTGSLQLRYEWNEIMENSTVEIEMYSNNYHDCYLKKTLVVPPSSSNISVNFTNLPSGYYLLKSKLNNNNVTFGGCVDAVKIINGEKTTGIINFSEEINSDYKELYIPYINGSPLTAHISGLSKINSTKDLQLELILDKQYDPSYNYILQWYLDGVLIEETDLKINENNISINSNSGMHILNAVILNREKHICGSLTEKFKTSVTGKTGVPVKDGIITAWTNKNLIIDNTSKFGLLPDNKCVVVTPDRGIMQLFSIVNSRPVVEQTLTASEKGTEWLYDTTALFSNKDMNMFLLNDYKINMDYMFYNPSTGKIENALLGDNILRLEGSTNIPSFCEFNGTRYATFIPSEDGGGVIASIDSKCSKGYQVVSSNSGPYLCCVLDVNASIGPKIMKGYDDKIVLSGSGTSIYSASFNGTQRTSKWYESKIGISDITDFIFLDRTNILVTNGNRIVHCRYNIGSQTWNSITSFEANVKHLISGNTSQYFYICDSDNNIITYSNNYYAFNKLDTTCLEEDIVKIMITTDNHMLCPCSDGSIVILTIIED